MLLDKVKSSELDIYNKIAETEVPFMIWYMLDKVLNKLLLWAVQVLISKFPNAA